jgi:hypothetical protein
VIQPEAPVRYRVWWTGVWAITLLVCLSIPAWSQDGQGQPLGMIQRNFPDPFSRRTAIPFEVLPVACIDGARPVVTIRILNVLVQGVASPTLRDSTGARTIVDLPLECGRYLAFWDRTLSDGTSQATPGSYFYRLFVNGESQGVRLMQVRGDIARPLDAAP